MAILKNIFYVIGGIADIFCGIWYKIHQDREIWIGGLCDLFIFLWFEKSKRTFFFARYIFTKKFIKILTFERNVIPKSHYFNTKSPLCSSFVWYIFVLFKLNYLIIYYESQHPTSRAIQRSSELSLSSDTLTKRHIWFLFILESSYLFQWRSRRNNLPSVFIFRVDYFGCNYLSLTSTFKSKLFLCFIYRLILTAIP